MCVEVFLALLMLSQKFFVLVNLVQRHPVEELVAELKARKTISKEQVLRESTLTIRLVL